MNYSFFSAPVPVGDQALTRWIGNFSITMLATAPTGSTQPGGFVTGQTIVVDGGVTIT
jgi:hypothetical protein